MSASTVSHQPNVPGKGIVAAYGAGFWVVVGGIGIGAGLAGAALSEVLVVVQRVAWSYRSGHGAFTDAVVAASPLRVLGVLALAGLLAGVGGLVIRRGGEVSEALWLRSARIPLLPACAKALLSMVTVALGSSLGREAAPQLVGAALAGHAADRARLPDHQRRLLVACGAGAGMAAAYDVPLGGALFALEVLLGTLTLPLVLPALATTLTATATAWIVVPNHPVYSIPTYTTSASLIAFAALCAGPVAGLAAVGYVRLIARAHRLRPTRPATRVAAPIVALTSLGAVALAYPELLGNGLDIVQRASLGQLSIGLLLALVALKPLATAACLGSGAPGGLFTPTLACGLLLGAVLGHGWLALLPGDSAPGAYALVGGGALLAAAMQGPLAAVVLLLELTRHTDALMVPMLLAVTVATVIARLLRAPSVYSARISA